MLLLIQLIWDPRKSIYKGLFILLLISRVGYKPFLIMLLNINLLTDVIVLLMVLNEG